MRKTTTKSEPQEQTVKMTAQEAQDAKDFAQSLIQSRGYKCDKVTTFSNANFLVESIFIAMINIGMKSPSTAVVGK